MRALVVDDSAVMRKVIIGALARADIVDVDQAADGQESVTACENADYDIVLMDWNMPNILGGGETLMDLSLPTVVSGDSYKVKYPPRRFG